jgi:hypothetical protein
MAEDKNEWVYTSTPPYAFKLCTVVTLTVPQKTVFLFGKKKVPKDVILHTAFGF